LTVSLNDPQKKPAVLQTARCTNLTALLFTSALIPNASTHSHPANLHDILEPDLKTNTNRQGKSMFRANYTGDHMDDSNCVWHSQNLKNFKVPYLTF